MKQDKIIDLVIELLYRIMYEGAYSSIIPIKIKEEDFAKGEENYALRISYGLLENWILLNHYLDELAKKRVTKKLKILLLLALYEIEFMDNNADHISVNSYVNYAKKNYPYAKNFVNAILREHLRRGCNRFKAKSFEDFAVYYSHPRELALLFKKSYGEKKAVEIMRMNQSKASINLRVNLSKLSSEDLILKLQEEGIYAKASHLSNRCLIVENLNNKTISDLETYKQGFFYIQDIASILLIDALGIKGHETVLDLCSAPGGKALGIAEDIEKNKGTGKVIACDIFPQKLEKIKENANRLGLELEVLRNDATVLNPSFVDRFDVVLADLPCSGLGIIRKKIEIKYRKLSQTMKSMIKLQEDMLRVSSQYVKLGGRLVYSTCTMNPEENEKQVEKFLKHHKSFVLEDITTMSLTSDSYLQLFTSEEIDGFFIAIMKRIA